MVELLVAYSSSYLLSSSKDEHVYSWQISIISFTIFCVKYTISKELFALDHAWQAPEAHWPSGLLWLVQCSQLCITVLLEIWVTDTLGMTINPFI